MIESMSVTAPLHTTAPELIAQGIWREAQVAKYTGLSRTSRWQLEREGQFPKKLQLSVRATGYWAHEVIAWATSRPIACGASKHPDTSKFTQNSGVTLPDSSGLKKPASDVIAFGESIYARAA